MGNAHLEWPFFDTHHRAVVDQLDTWAGENVAQIHSDDTDGDCKRLVRLMGEAGWLRYAVAGMAYGGVTDAIDTRAVCLIRCPSSNGLRQMG